MTMIGHISREEVAPGHAEQEWTAHTVWELMGHDYGSDGWIREKLVAAAHNASLAKERERLNATFKDMARQIDQLRTELAEAHEWQAQFCGFDDKHALDAAITEAQKPLVEALKYSKQVQEFAKSVTTGRQDRQLAQMEKTLEQIIDTALAKVK